MQPHWGWNMRDNLELSARFQIHTGCRVHQLLIKQWLLITVSLNCCCDEFQIFGLVVCLFVLTTVEHISHMAKNNGKYPIITHLNRCSFKKWIHFHKGSCNYVWMLKRQYFGRLLWKLTHWKRPWCWERLKTGGEGDDRGRGGWVASPTWWTWIWASSGSWWRTGMPGMLQSTGLQRVRHVWVTEKQP